MRQLLWCAAAALLLSGESCANESLQPIVARGDQIRDPAIVGFWVSDRDSVSISESSDGGYIAESWSHDAAQRSRIMLTRIGNATFVESAAAENIDRHLDQVIDVHALGRLESTRPTLVYRPMDAEWLQDYLLKNPNAIGYLLINGNRYVFTDSTPALRAFLAKHMADAGFWAADSMMWTYRGPPRSAPSRR